MLPPATTKGSPKKPNQIRGYVIYVQREKI